MNTWPDGTHKSTGNAFNWRNGAGSQIVAKNVNFRASLAGRAHGKSPAMQVKPNATLMGISHKSDERIRKQLEAA